MIRLIWVFLISFFYTIPLFIVFFLHSLWFKRSDFRHLIAKHWAGFILFISGIKVKVTGSEYISKDKVYLFVANHQSSFDIFSILAKLNNQFRFISKPLYFKLPIIGYAMRHTGYIPIDSTNSREAVKSILKSAQTLKENYSVFIFPEGTRSEDGNVLPFKPGAIKIIESSGLDLEVVPITIEGSIRIQRKDSLILNKAKVNIVIGRPILVTQQMAKDKEKRITILKQLENGIRKTYKKYSH